MTATDTTPHRGSSAVGQATRKRSVRFIAATAAVGVAATAIVSAGGGSAGAATAPNAQSAGNFVDATAGGKPIDQILKLAFARAENPGSVTDQNPLDVTALDTINLPLTGALQFPEIAGIRLGAVNQVALAKSDGQSYGAAGAVSNSGGVSVGGDNNAFPASATINLTASGLSGNSPIPVPGGTGSADALGGITAEIGAVSSVARTPKFGPPFAKSWLATCTQSEATCYDIASLNLKLGSPLLGELLSQLLSTFASTFAGLVTQLTNAVGGLPGGSAALATCALTSPTAITKPISLDNGAVVLSPLDGSITIDLQALLKTLGLNINDLPPNTDLFTKLLDYLASPNGLAKGIEGVINGVTDVLTAQFNGCKAAIQAIPGIGNLLVTLVGALTSGQTTLESTINQVVAGLSNAGGPNPLAPISTLLGQLIDVGVNVQPRVSSGDFTTMLNRLPKQGMVPPPVPYQYVVRALEVQVLGGAVTLALANSAAGPSNPATPAPTSTAPPSTAAPTTAIPTGVPAGAAGHGGSPVLPLVLLLLGLSVAGGGVVSYRMRGKFSR